MSEPGILAPGPAASGGRRAGDTLRAVSAVDVSERRDRWTARAASVTAAGSAIGAAVALVERADLVAAGLAAVSGVLLLVGAVLAHGATFLVERTLDSFADRVFDGAVLGAVAWVERADGHPSASAAALLSLTAGFLGSYVRARGNSLAYRVEESAVTRAIRYALVAAVLALGSPAWLLWTLAGFLLLAAFVRASQVAKEERA